MKETWHKLTEFLVTTLPENIPYDDLAQLCLGLHIYIDGIPSDLQPLLNKDDQAMAFAEFVRQKFDDRYGFAISARYGANFHRATEKGHWIEVIASIYKMGNTFDSEREKDIRENMMANKGIKGIR